MVILASIAITAPAFAASPSEIDASLDRAKAWLYSQQKDDRWEIAIDDSHGDQVTGTTALVVYALLSSGESAQDSRIAKAIEYLKKTDTTGVYALGMRCQVWLMLPQTADVKRAITRDAGALQGMLITQKDGRGFYPYNTGKTPWSLSRAQYAVLGLWAAAQTGYEVPTSYWQIIEKAWIDAQDAGGGWSYKADKTQPITAGITAVGVATLYITQEYLHAGYSATPGGNINSPNIDKGMKWMIDNFDKVAASQAYDRDYPYATLYAVERIGVASGRKYLGTIDWYDKGATWLMPPKQRRDGAWSAERHGAMVNTAFAMLFLSRGRAPLGMNKLDYTINGTRRPAPWNQRPRDVANVTRWVGRQIEKDLNWQIVNLTAPVEEWHDAPILYISGSEELILDPAAKAKIKQFIEAGGLVLGNADASNQNFVRSFQSLGRELFRGYEFRELLPEHVIYTRQQFPLERWRNKLRVQGLSNGVRELMLLAPTVDPARWWQTQTVAAHEEFWQLASNIFLYSVDSKVLRKRGESYLITRDATPATGTVKLARLKHPGNWDPEPEGWRRLSNLLHNRSKLDLEIAVVDLAKDSLAGFKVAHLTGTNGLNLDEAARQKLKTFVESGGTLVVDAAGGSSAFATAAERELAATFGDGKLLPLPKDNRLFSAGGIALTTFRYRDYASTMLGSLQDEPRLKAIEINGRPAVIYSREDLSAGLVGQAVNGIIGYDPATASEIMVRVVLRAAGK